MIFLNLREYELPLEHSLVLLLFGGVYIVRKTLLTNPQLGQVLKKAIMRQQVFPPYYLRELLCKLEQLKQGSNTVHAYYQEFKSYMHHCDIEESEDDSIIDFLVV